MAELFAIVTTTSGAVSIRNNLLGEIMHNPVGPWVEANALYIEPSGLKQRLNKETEDLVLFDVGLGAAANAVAALHAAREAKRRLHVVSFERDLELLRFTLTHASQFPHLHGYEEALAAILDHGQWSNENILWQLRHGDFLETLKDETLRPELIFYDPYSSKVNQEMWSVETFKLVREKCAEQTLLLTYSQATPIRVALLAAGFFVGHGIGSGPKEETTQAATDLSALSAPLAAKWLGRWKRSHVQVPRDNQNADPEKIRAMILNHPQFTSF